MFVNRLAFTPLRRLVALLLLGLAFTLLVPHGAFAAISSCRADPIVWLSNGDSVQMTVSVNAEPAHVRRITYTLHAPAGVTIDRIVYTGGALQSKEEVVFVADQVPGQYVTDTVVTTRGKGIGVTANTAESGTFRGSVSGFNSEHLVLNFTTAP